MANKIKKPTWEDVKRIVKLSAEEVEMAKQCGMSPRDVRANQSSTRQEKWKSPTPEWIRDCWDRKFGPKRRSKSSGGNAGRSTEPSDMQTTSTDHPEDVEISIERGDFRMTVAPYGASLRGLEGRPPGGEWQALATCYHGAANKEGGQGDVLIPFPGRIGGGRYTFNGVEYKLEQNDHDGPNAIHGFVRKKLWESIVVGDSVEFTTSIAPDEYAGYPFSIDVSVTYRLDDKGLTTEFSITNTGDKPAPVAAGFHPYFTIGTEFIDRDWLYVPMESYLEFDRYMIPTGRVIPVDGTPYDHRECHPIRETAFNTCYLGTKRGPDGKQRISLTESSNRHGVTVWMDKAFDYVVIYSGESMPESHRRRSLAIEPMTCASDGFNHPEWGLVTLAPGETFAGAWGVETRWE